MRKWTSFAMPCGTNSTSSRNGFESVKVNLEGLPEQAEKAVQRQTGERVRANLQAAKRERVELTWADLKARADPSGIAETKETVNQWKANREMRKLRARADRAEASCRVCH